ncbi:dynein axonemal assembly factor 6 [Periplaneta americana]|uniref:dynein axonemal assembly factor 6 n=1 Tax=Periplaneta americana TaxID=6978 RepID=UPI0037E8452D
MELGYKDLRRLAEMLKPADEESDSEDDLPQSGLSKLGPGHIGPKGSSTELKTRDTTASDGDAIWDESEVPEDSVVDDSSDPREKPEFELSYRQAVTPEDVFLQLGAKTPGTASCEDLVVRVSLPGEARDQVHLAVKRRHLDVRSPRYRLALALPHPVDPDEGRAEWRDGQLWVVMRMRREFDFVNF